MTTQYTTNRILNAANFSCVNMCVDEQWGESQLARSDFHAMHRYHDSIEIEREKKLCLRGIVTFLFVCFLSFSSSFHFTALQQFFVCCSISLCGEIVLCMWRESWMFSKYIICIPTSFWKKKKHLCHIKFTFGSSAFGFTRTRTHTTVIHHRLWTVTNRLNLSKTVTL